MSAASRSEPTASAAACVRVARSVYSVGDTADLATLVFRTLALSADAARIYACSLSMEARTVLTSV